jgi:hypothetical protein
MIVLFWWALNRQQQLAKCLSFLQTTTATTILFVLMVFVEEGLIPFVIVDLLLLDQIRHHPHQQQVEVFQKGRHQIQSFLKL